MLEILNKDYRKLLLDYCSKNNLEPIEVLQCLFEKLEQDDRVDYSALAFKTTEPAVIKFKDQFLPLDYALNMSVDAYLTKGLIMHMVNGIYEPLFPATSKIPKRVEEINVTTISL